MNTEELRKKSVSDLNKELDSLLTEQFNLRMQRTTGQLSRNHMIKHVRRNIARVKTLITEKSKEQS